MEILVSGSLAIDRIMTYNGRFGDHIVPERIHQINLSFTVDSFHAYFGGTAGNIAYSLAMLGQQPRLIAAIGFDYRTAYAYFGNIAYSLAMLGQQPRLIAAIGFDYATISDGSSKTVSLPTTFASSLKKPLLPPSSPPICPITRSPDSTPAP